MSLSNCRRGNIHSISCPHCDHNGEVNIPLLIFRPEDEPAIFFSPAQGTTQEQNQQQVQELIKLLKDNLGIVWNADWLKQDIPSVPRHFLLAALSEDPGDAQKDLAEKKKEDLERFKHEFPEPVLLLATFISKDLHRKQEFLENNPELLSENADALLEQLIHAAEEQPNENIKAVFEVHRTLLRRCRENGIAPAIKELEIALQNLDCNLTQDSIPQELQDDFQQATQGRAQYERTGDVDGLLTSINAWERILKSSTLAASSEAFRRAAWNDAALSFKCQFHSTGDTIGLDKALHLWQQAVDVTPVGHPDLPSILTNLGSGLHERYRRMEHMTDLDEAIRIWQQVVDVTPRDHPNLSLILTDLAGVLHGRYHCTENMADLEEAIRIWQQAVDVTPVGHSKLPSLLNNLGAGLRERYIDMGSMADLEEGIRISRQAVDVTPEAYSDLPSILTNLGSGLHERYRRTEHMVDLEEAIRILRQAVDVSPEAYSDLPLILTNLGSGLHERYRRMEQMADLDEAIRIWQQAVDVTPVGHSKLPSILTILGSGLHERYRRTEHMVDLEGAIRVLRQAMDVTPEAYSDLPSILTNLGSGLHDRYRRMEQMADLDEAIRIWQQAVDVTPVGHSKLPSILTILGSGLHERYRCTEHMADLEEAIRIWQQAVDVTPEGYSDLPSLLNNLSTGILDRHIHMGSIDDLEVTIRVLRQAVNATLEGNPDLLFLLNNLGFVLRARYIDMGHLDDLEEAICIWKQAVDVTPEGYSDLPSIFTNLGNGLHDRYQRTRNMADLEEAIRIWQQAVDVTPVGHSELPKCLSSLGVGLRERYRRTEHMDDLEEAIRISRQAVDATPIRHSDLSLYLNNLGAGLLERYIITDRMADLEEALRNWKQAMAASPQNHPNLPSVLTNLGSGLFTRYSRTGRMADLEEALRNWKQAVAATPQNHPNLPSVLTNLGSGLRARYRLTGCMNDLDEAIHSYQQACTFGLKTNISEVSHAARNWQIWAFERQSWEEVLQASEALTQALEQQLLRQFEHSDKNHSLQQNQGLSAQTAFAHLHLNQSEKAIETLEQGRAKLMREALEHQREDLKHLTELGFKDIFDQFANATKGINDLQSISFEKRPQNWAQQMEKAISKEQDAAQVIREQAGVKYPQYRFFLRALPFEEIQKLAQSSPLIYLAYTEQGGFALIVHAQNKPQVVKLPDLTNLAIREKIIGAEEKISYLRTYLSWRADPYNVEKRENWKYALDETLKWLWNALMAEVLGVLQECYPKNSQIRIIPCGLLSILPLHAAWKENQECSGNRHYALDDFLITYAPSAQALYYANIQTKTSYVDTLLAVDNPDGSLIEFSQPTVRVACDVFKGKFTHLMQEEADFNTVQKALNSHDVLFFFTHGNARFDEPLQSGLKLADHSLTLEDLLAMHLNHPRLAILAACETGIPSDLSTLDEVVSLPSGLMQANVPGVVGTLWTVLATSTSILMTIFFEIWKKNNLPPAEALRQAQIILRQARFSREERNYFKKDIPVTIQQYMTPEAIAKVLDIHMQVDDYDHPFYWAAFTYTGL